MYHRMKILMQIYGSVMCIMHDVHCMRIFSSMKIQIFIFRQKSKLQKWMLWLIQSNLWEASLEIAMFTYFTFPTMVGLFFGCKFGLMFAINSIWHKFHNLFCKVIFFQTNMQSSIISSQRLVKEFFVLLDANLFFFFKSAEKVL